MEGAKKKKKKRENRKGGGGSAAGHGMRAGQGTGTACAACADQLPGLAATAVPCVGRRWMGMDGDGYLGGISSSRLSSPLPHFFPVQKEKKNTQ